MALTHTCASFSCTRCSLSHYLDCSISLFQDLPPEALVTSTETQTTEPCNVVASSSYVSIRLMMRLTFHDLKVSSRTEDVGPLNATASTAVHTMDNTYCIAVSIQEVHFDASTAMSSSGLNVQSEIFRPIEAE